jgi:hypothetical protein
MTRSRSQLSEAISDIDFEMSQIVDLVLEIDRQHEQQRSPLPDSSAIPSATVYIACLESALLHVRALIDFLNTAGERDITVNDYIQRWSLPRSEALKRLRRRRKLFDKHLSHLTWSRVTERAKNSGENPEWNVRELADDLLSVFMEFVTHLKAVDPEAGDWFDGTLATASIKLRGTWPEIVPRPAPGSPLAAYVPRVTVRGPTR